MSQMERDDLRNDLILLQNAIKQGTHAGESPPQALFDVLLRGLSDVNRIADALEHIAHNMPQPRNMQDG